MDRAGTSPFLFTVAFNGDDGLVDALLPLAGLLAEVVLPAPPEAVPGALAPWGAFPPGYADRLPDLVARLATAGIGPAIDVATPAVRPADQARVLDFLCDVAAAGVKVVSLSDLHLAMAIRGRLPGLGLVAAAHANVFHVARARHWVREVGVSRIVTARSLNRLPEALAVLRRAGVPLEVIAESGCLPSCPWAWSCFEAPVDGRDAFRALCGPVVRGRPWELFQVEILPFRLHRLAGIVSHVRVAAGDRSTAQVVDAVRRAVEASDDVHAVHRYREPAGAWERVAGCDRVCEACGWCEAAFREVNPGWDGGG